MRGTDRGILVQLVEHGVVAILEHEVQLALAPEHLQQVHQVRMLQVLPHKRYKLHIKCLNLTYMKNI